MNPELLLLDEPLSALDALTRAKLQDEIEQIWMSDRKTVILITIDVDEQFCWRTASPPQSRTERDARARLQGGHPTPARLRMAMNNNPAYKALRAAVTSYLMEVGIEPKAKTDDSRVLPNVVPVTQADAPPPAYTEAAASPIEERYLEFSQLGIARAEAAITLANIAYNMKRWCWLDGRAAPA